MLRSTLVMKSVIVVTGSSGLIGRALARRLAETHDVVGLDSRPPKRIAPLREHIHLDVTKDDTVQTALRRLRGACAGRIASFIHLAAFYDFSGEPSPLYDAVTVEGTARLLRRLHAFDVEQLIFASSMLVHAPGEKGRPLTEGSPLAGRWAYPKSKLAAEQLLREHRHRIPLVVLRLAGVYGDGCQSIPLARQIARIFERRLVSRVFPGDVSKGQAFVHLDDAVEAFARCVECRHALPRETTLLIGEAQTYGYDTIQRTIARELHGEEWETRQLPKPLAKAGAWVRDQVPGEEPFIKPWMIDLADDHYELDVSRARQLLRWQPRRTLLGTLPEMVAALHADPLGWYREHDLPPPGWLVRQQREQPGRGAEQAS